VKEWLVTPWEHFEDTIVGHNYPLLLKGFASAAQIRTLSDDDLFEGLSVIHSFDERFRFFGGGTPTWKKVFLAANDPKRTRDSLAYLLYGTNVIERRMADLIYSPSWKLNQFGQANVQELIGWLNEKELPVINGRTTKVLKFL
jgi:hypothetical protein